MNYKHTPAVWRWRDPEDINKKRHKRRWLYSNKKPRGNIDDLEELYTGAIVQRLYAEINRLRGHEGAEVTSEYLLSAKTPPPEQLSEKQRDMISWICSSTTRHIANPFEENALLSKKEAQSFISQWRDFAPPSPKQRKAVLAICKKVGIPVPPSYDQRFIQALFWSQDELERRHALESDVLFYNGIQQAALKGEDYPTATELTQVCGLTRRSEK
ncbi:hypothetical protein G6L37_04715 [Agrobacterium rubi]|nr:hypothetical protein [Agrobacterium rubi]NTF24656.1 hypothetical protein [Agrobacterium rubi]